MTIYETIQTLRTGPGQFRFFVQPLVAILLAIRDGHRDARAGAPPYLFSVLTGSGQRKERLKIGFRAIAMPFLVAFVMDAVIQLSFLRDWRPTASVIVALLLIAVPYACVRGLANRAVCRYDHARHA